MTKKPKQLVDYLPLFVAALTSQLLDDQDRWGDTWKKRPVAGQEDRIFGRFTDYYDRYKNGGTPVPWLKIVGLALIAWVRETQNHNE